MRISPEVLAAQRRLGADPQRLAGILRLASLEEAKKALAELKAEVKKTYKRLALELHPDRHNDPVKTEELVRLTQVRDEVLGLEIGVRPPPPQLRPRPTVVPFTVVVQFGSRSPSTNQTTSSSGSQWETPVWWPPKGSGTY